MELVVTPWNLTPIGSESQRDPLIRFWLAAPLDQLEQLWDGPWGEATTQLVRQLNESSSFTPEQIQLRNALNEKIQQKGFSSSESIQILIAAFLLSPPGLLSIANADKNLPSWLLPRYQALYEKTEVQPQQSLDSDQSLAPNIPDFGPFPSTLEELSSNRIQLNRMLGLANLYYIDPEDHEIMHELQTLRSDLSKAINNCDELKLEEFWSGEIGDRYWAVVRSGIQKEPLTHEDQELKNQVTQRLQPSQGGGFGTSGAVKAFLIAMMYFEPGTMKVDDAKNKLPGWLLPNFDEIFSAKLTNQA